MNNVIQNVLTLMIIYTSLLLILYNAHTDIYFIYYMH